jgi:hypothetical protein
LLYITKLQLIGILDAIRKRKRRTNTIIRKLKSRFSKHASALHSYKVEIKGAIRMPRGQGSKVGRGMWDAEGTIKAIDWLELRPC